MVILGFFILKNAQDIELELSMMKGGIEENVGLASLPQIGESFTKLKEIYF